MLALPIPFGFPLKLPFRTNDGGYSTVKTTTENSKLAFLERVEFKQREPLILSVAKELHDRYEWLYLTGGVALRLVYRISQTSVHDCDFLSRGLRDIDGRLYISGNASRVYIYKDVPVAIYDADRIRGFYRLPDEHLVRVDGWRTASKESLAALWLLKISEANRLSKRNLPRVLLEFAIIADQLSPDMEEVRRLSKGMQIEPVTPKRDPYWRSAMGLISAYFGIPEDEAWRHVTQLLKDLFSSP